MPVWLPQLLYYAPRRLTPVVPDEEDSDSASDGGGADVLYADSEIVEYWDGEAVEYDYEET